MHFVFLAFTTFLRNFVGDVQFLFLVYFPTLIFFKFIYVFDGFCRVELLLFWFGLQTQQIATTLTLSFSLSISLSPSWWALCVFFFLNSFNVLIAVVLLGIKALTIPRPRHISTDHSCLQTPNVCATVCVCVCVCWAVFFFCCIRIFLNSEYQLKMQLQKCKTTCVNTFLPVN